MLFALCRCPKGPGKGAFEKKDPSLEPKLFRSSPVKMAFLIEPGVPWPAGNKKRRSRLSAELFNLPNVSVVSLSRPERLSSLFT